MLSHQELVELYRELRQEKVLSIFLDGRSTDFSEHNLWRRRFERDVAEIRERLRSEDPGEASAFERAAQRVGTALDEYDRFLPEHGWVGFATSDRLVYGEPVRVPMPDLIRWELGLRVAPYVRALKQDRIVVGVLVDARRARLFEYREGTMTETTDLLAETYVGDLTDSSMSKRAGNRTGVRGETGTDAAQRFLEVGSERMLKELADVVAERTGSQGLVVLGGSAEAVASLAQHLPGSITDRMAQRSSMNFHMSDTEIREALEASATDLGQKVQQDLLSEVIDLARSGGRGALGPEEVEQAVREGRVDTLLLSRTFITKNPDYADHLVGAAFQHGGEVEELSLDRAQRLDSEGRGVAARLRYHLNH